MRLISALQAQRPSPSLQEQRLQVAERIYGIDNCNTNSIPLGFRKRTMSSARMPPNPAAYSLRIRSRRIVMAAF